MHFFVINKLTLIVTVKHFLDKTCCSVNLWPEFYSSKLLTNTFNNTVFGQRNVHDIPANEAESGNEVWKKGFFSIIKQWH